MKDLIKKENLASVLWEVVNRLPGFGIVIIKYYTLMEYLNVDEKKISVVYGGVSKNFRKLNKEESKEAIKREYSINRDFILYVGNLELRKNIVRLVKAYANIRQKGEYSLVIVGTYRWYYDEIIFAVKNLDVKDNIFFLNYIDTNDLVHFYNSASLFVYPSLYEGFGLPPLEAMAPGRKTCPPTWCRSRTSHRRQSPSRAGAPAW